MLDSPSSESTLPSLNPIKGLFKDSWHHYKERFWTYFGIIAIPTAINLATYILVLEWKSAIATALQLPIALFINELGLAALIFSISREIGIKESYRQTLKIFWPIVWTYALCVGVIVGGLTMFIIPGIIVSIWILFYNYVLVIEDLRGFKALLRSKEYVANYWSAVFRRYFSYIVPYLTLALIFVFSVIHFFYNTIALSVTLRIVQLFAVPFIAIYLYKIYLNLKAVKPELSTSKAPKRSGFLKTSLIIGAIAMVIIIISVTLINIYGSTMTWKLYPLKNTSVDVRLPVPPKLYTHNNWDNHIAQVDSSTIFVVAKYNGQPDTDPAHSIDLVDQTLKNNLNGDQLVSSTYSLFGQNRALDYFLKTSDGYVNGKIILHNGIIYDAKFIHAVTSTVINNEYDIFINSLWFKN